MNRFLRITGYDKLTERLSIARDLPEELAETARLLAHVENQDDGLGAYPLAAAAVAKLDQLQTKDATVSSLAASLEHYDWFLEHRDEEPEPVRQSQEFAGIKGVG